MFCYKFHLLALFFAGSCGSGSKVEYVDGDSTKPIINKLRVRPRQFGVSNVRVYGKDVNPQLFGSIRGLPGLKFRINPYGFSYASLLISPIISEEIVQTRLPPSKQCFQQLNGCITMYNLFVSRYRCPQLVSIYPSPPNRLLVDVRNFDIEITGNIGGEVEVILPITLSGIVLISAHQVSVTAQLTVHRASGGSPYVHVSKCYVFVGFTDVIMQNGDLVGDVFNSQFRGTAAEQVRRILPTRICTMIPDVIRKKLNSRLYNMPKMIPLSKLTNFAKDIINSISTGQLPKHCRTPLCQQRIQRRDTIIHLSAPTATQKASGLLEHAQRRDVQKFAGKDNAVIDPIPWSVRTDSTELQPRPLRTISATVIAKKRNTSQQRKVIRTIREAAHPVQAHRQATTQSQRLSSSTRPLQRVTIAPSPVAPSINARVVKTSSLDPCVDCYPNNESNPLFVLSSLSKAIDMRKLSDLMLNLQLIKTSATPNDFTIALSGEFSPKGRGGTPFHPFPMEFPRTHSNGYRMLEVLISDYTINTLFYYMHKREFLSFHVGPETPRIGELLKTTCGDDDYDYMDDSGVDDDEDFDEKTSSTTPSTNSKKRQKRKAADDDEEDKGIENSLADLGVCLGDIMPAIREKHPKKLLHIKIHSTRAPSLVLSAKNGGMASLSMEAEAALYIDDNGEKVGAIGIRLTTEAKIRISDNRITAFIEIRSLKLVDKQQTLGLPQDALDNLASISKDVIAKMANDALSNGIVVQLPTAKLPFSFVKPRFTVVEHALHLSSDFRVSARALGITSSSICRRF